MKYLILLLLLASCTVKPKVEGLIFSPPMTGCAEGSRAGYYIIYGYNTKTNQQVTLSGIAPCNLELLTHVCSENGLTFVKCGD